MNPLPDAGGRSHPAAAGPANVYYEYLLLPRDGARYIFLLHSINGDTSVTAFEQQKIPDPATGNLHVHMTWIVKRGPRRV